MHENILQFKELGWLFVFISGFVVFLALGFIFFYKSSKNVIYAKRLEMEIAKQHYKQLLLRSAIETEEQERRRIARELHDDVSSSLNLIIMNIGIIEQHKYDAEFETQLLKNISNMAHKSLCSIQEIAHGLMPVTLDKFGLDSAIQDLITDVTKSTGLLIYYDNKGFKDKLAKDLNLHVFRIIQELINNSVNHGNATKLHIHVQSDNQSMSVFYSDDGRGFDLEIQKLLSGKGMGLKNIYARTEILGGSIKITGAPNNGMSAILTIRKNYG